MNLLDLRSHFPHTYDARAAAITQVVYHHSTGRTPVDRDDALRVLDAIYRWHTTRLGWPGIGYHYAIDPAGMVYWLTDISIASNHVSGHNNHTVGVAFLGDYSDSRPSDAALWVAAELHHRLEHTLERVFTIVGHAELNPASSAFCPSRRWYEWKPTIVRRRTDARVTVLPYLDSLWGKAAEIDHLATAIQVEAQAVRDYVVLVKHAVGLE